MRPVCSACGLMRRMSTPSGEQRRQVGQQVVDRADWVCTPLSARKGSPSRVPAGDAVGKLDAAKRAAVLLQIEVAGGEAACRKGQRQASVGETSVSMRVSRARTQFGQRLFGDISGGATKQVAPRSPSMPSVM